MSERHSNVITAMDLADPPPSPALSLHSLWKPYVYKGIGFDIYDPWGEIWGPEEDQ